jgi:hypothetical protein
LLVGLVVAHDDIAGFASFALCCRNWHKGCFRISPQEWTPSSPNAING